MQISQLYFANRGKKAHFSRSLQNSHPLSHREQPEQQRRYLSQNKDSLENGKLTKLQVSKSKKTSVNSLANKPELGAKDKKTEKMGTKTTYSKNPNKPKHPIIRSFIIKEPRQQTLAEMMLDCNFQHNNFICLLDECINKRSLNVSTKIDTNINKKPQEGVKDDDINLSESFNNLKVKQSLKSASINGLNFSVSPKAKLTQKYNRQMIRKSIKLNKNYSMISNQTDNKQRLLNSPDKEYADRDYTNITDYNLNESLRKNTFESEVPVNNTQAQRISINIASSLKNYKNQTSYLWNFKQRKLRERGQITVKSKLQANYTNSQLLGGTSKQKQKYVSVKKNPFRDSGLLPQKQGKKVVYNTCHSPSKIEENSPPKSGDLNIFTNIPIHTPTKRKISTQGLSIKKSIDKRVKMVERPSQARGKDQEQEGNFTNNLSSLNKEDLDEGNSCYLRTVNF